MHTTSSAATPTGGRIALALAAVYVIWGSTYLGIRFALEGGFPPFLLGGIRFLIAGGLMYAFLRWRGVPAPTRPQWRNASVMGLLLMLFGNGMVNLAEQTVSSGMTAVAVASAPLWRGLSMRTSASRCVWRCVISCSTAFSTSSRSSRAGLCAACRRRTRPRRCRR